MSPQRSLPSWLMLLPALLLGRRLARVGRQLIVPGLILSIALLASRRAEACGMGPTPRFAVSAMSPASGATGVARDAGIIVSGTVSPEATGYPLDADVALIDLDGEVSVPLREISWGPREGLGPLLAVHPVEPLEPLHTYRVEATTVDPYTLERSAPLVSTFTTSDAVLEPVVLSGEIGLSLRAGEVDILASGLCGEPRPSPGKRAALLADVQLPAPGGGQGLYHAVLHFTDHAPARIHPLNVASYDPDDGVSHDIRLSRWFELEPGEALLVSQEIFEEESPYAGCFSFVVWDPAGHVAQTSACLPVIAPDEVRALTGSDMSVVLSADARVAADQVDAALVDAGRSDRGPVWSCALRTSTDSALPAWLALVPAMLIGRRFSPVRAARRG